MHDFAPPATLIVPCRGVEPGLAENLRAYLALDYPDLQILFVTGDAHDDCVSVVRQVLREFQAHQADLVFAGRHSHRGQKVHALLRATRHARPHDRVFAFGDSDGRPHGEWLRALVSGLHDPAVGATTGFRWYAPQQGNFASVLRSVWNGAAATLFDRRNAPFAWGGAMALRRDTFAAARVAEYWDRALSDDYALSRAVRDQGLWIRFEPRCLTFTHEDCTLRELLQWSFRQLVITRVYRPALWTLGVVSEVFGNVVFWGGLALLAAGLLGAGRLGGAAGLLGAFLVAIYATRAA